MIIKKILPNGKTQYIDVVRKRSVQLQRGGPCSLRRMPNYVFQYLSPAPSKIDNMSLGFGTRQTNNPKKEKKKLTAGAFGKQVRVPQKH